MDEDGEEHLPDEIDGERVWGCEGEFMVGESLVPHDDDAQITVGPGDADKALEWLRTRGWNVAKDFDQAWARILQARGTGPEEQPLPSAPRP